MDATNNDQPEASRASSGAIRCNPVTWLFPWNTRRSSCGGTSKGPSGRKRYSLDSSVLTRTLTTKTNLFATDRSVRFPPPSRIGYHTTVTAQAAEDYLLLVISLRLMGGQRLQVLGRGFFGRFFLVSIPSKLVQGEVHLGVTRFD